jgi:chromate reductase, NAD(P)H dehydrogenase (quinone)
LKDGSPAVRWDFFLCDSLVSIFGVQKNKMKKKILAICGSTRKTSTNSNLINAIYNMYADAIAVTIFEGLSGIPHFSPDLDNDNPPQNVSHFRKQLKQADGILICTPEYAMGVPGTLKNAIDWTVSSMEFSHKPVALITASTSGHKAHHSLMETLRVIEADVPDNSHLVISHIRTKVQGDSIIDTNTANQVKNAIDSLLEVIGNRES